MYLAEILMDAKNELMANNSDGYWKDSILAQKIRSALLELRQFSFQHPRTGDVIVPDWDFTIELSQASVTVAEDETITVPTDMASGGLRLVKVTDDDELEIEYVYVVPDRYFNDDAQYLGICTIVGTQIYLKRDYGEIEGYVPVEVSGDTIELVYVKRPDTAAITSFGDITAVADNGSGKARCSSTAHGLSTSSAIVIASSNHYDGQQTISAAATDTFDLTAAYHGTSKGTWYISSELVLPDEFREAVMLMTCAKALPRNKTYLAAAQYYDEEYRAKLVALALKQGKQDTNVVLGQAGSTRWL